MKILLILPAAEHLRVTVENRKVPSRTMPRFSLLPLTTVAALTPAEHEVTICDENIRAIDYDAEVDLVGVSFMTALAPRAYEIAREFRRRGRITVAGGYHPTLLPDEVAKHFDAVVKGEAEELWPRLLADVNAGRLQRIYCHERLPNLSLTPIPRRELNRAWQRYYATSHAVQTGRGCNHGCRFCSVTAFYRQTYRHRLLDQVIAELRQVPRNFMFVDDNIIADPEFSRVLFTAMIPLEKRWVSQCSLKIADDPELLALAKQAGCIGLFVGLESLNKENLAALDKTINTEHDNRERICRIQHAGIAVQTAVIVGLDHDDVNVFGKTLRFLQKTHIAALQLSIVTPLPGTPLYNDFSAAGRMVDKDWSHYDFRHVVFKPARMSAQQLQEGADWLYHQFYRLDRIVLRCLWVLFKTGPLAAFLCWRLNLTYRYDNKRERIIGRDPAKKRPVSSFKFSVCRIRKRKAFAA